MEELISIIVPVYNTKEFLPKCLDSVFNQTYKNLEIILVDDGSTDGSAEICDKYANEDSRFIVIHKKNEGVSKARNDGLRIARGKYIGFVDSDDTIEPEMYSLLYHNLVEDNADVSICNLSLIKGSKVVFWSNLKEKIVYNQEEAIKEVLLDRAYIGSPCNKLFNRHVLESLYFQEDIYYAEDKIFVVQAFLNSHKVVFDPVSKYNYFERENSACTSVFTEKTYTLHIAQEIILKEILKTINDELIECVYVSMLFSDIVLLGKLYYAKEMREKYCLLLKESIRQNISLKRLTKLNNFQRIGVISACIGCKVFFVLFWIKEQFKKIDV